MKQELDELIKSPSYLFTKFQNKFYSELSEYLSKKENTQVGLSKKLGVSKGYVSQVVNNGYDHKISNFFKLSLAIGKIPRIEFLEPEAYLNLETNQRIDDAPLELKELACMVASEPTCETNVQFEKDDLTHYLNREFLAA